LREKNTLRRIAQRTKNCGDKRNYETLNSIVKDVCQELQNKNLCQKLSTIGSNHKSLFNFTKLIKIKSRGVPAPKVYGVTLLTGSEKAEVIASKFSAAHKNTMSSPLEDIVEDGCSVLENNEFNLEASILTSPREIEKIIKNLKNSKAKTTTSNHLKFDDCLKC
jgi:hypothetical protein